MRATPNNATSSFSRLYSVCAIKTATYRFFTTSFNGSTVNRETFRSFQVVPDNVRALVQRPIRYLSPVSSPSKVIQANETYKFEATVVSSSSKISSVGGFIFVFAPGEELARCVRLNPAGIHGRHSRKGKLDFKAARDFRNTRQGQRTDLTTA